MTFNFYTKTSRYSQESYAYDDWGNRTKTTTYSEYGRADESPPGGERSSFTCY